MNDGFVIAFGAIVLFLLTHRVALAADEAEAAVPVETAELSLYDQLLATAEPDAPPKSTLRSLVSREKPVKIAERTVTERTTYGEVGTINPNGIFLVSEKDQEGGTLREIWLPYTQYVGLEGYGNVKEFRKGDVVRVTYEEVSDVTKRMLKSVKLYKRKYKLEDSVEKKDDARASVVSVNLVREKDEKSEPETSEQTTETSTPQTQSESQKKESTDEAYYEDYYVDVHRDL